MSLHYTTVSILFIFYILMLYLVCCFLIKSEKLIVQNLDMKLTIDTIVTNVVKSPFSVIFALYNLDQPK